MDLLRHSLVEEDKVYDDDDNDNSKDIINVTIMVCVCLKERYLLVMEDSDHLMMVDSHLQNRYYNKYTHYLIHSKLIKNRGNN